MECIEETATAVLLILIVLVPIVETIRAARVGKHRHKKSRVKRDD